MVVLDAVHKIQAEHSPDLACRWNCKRASAAAAAPRSTQATPHVHDRLATTVDKPITVTPMQHSR